MVDHGQQDPQRNDTPQEPSLDVDDIMKEFSAPDWEEIVKEFSPEILDEKPTAPPAGDTIRLDSIQESLRRQPPAEAAQPETAAEEAPAQPPVDNMATQRIPVVEPFSENWEPEYEEPMGAYTPKEPIRFQSRDQARLMREKLVLGPEKRYYELIKAGMSSLRISAALLFLLFLAAAGITLAFHWGWIGENRTKLVVFCQLLAVLLAALLSHNRLLDGLASLFRGRFTLHTLLAITAIVCCVDALMCLGQERISCCSIFCLQTAMAQWAACHARRTETQQMDTLRKAAELTAVVKIPNYYKGAAGYVTTEGQPEAFLDRYQVPGAPEKRLHIFSAIGAFLCLALAIVTGIRIDLTAGMQVLTAGLLVLVPATAFLCMRRPEWILEKRLHKVGTVLCGWQGIKAVQKRAAVPITHGDLFPSDAIGMNGMKFYGSIDPDMVLCYAGSLIGHEGGSLKAPFDQLMASRYIRHAAVEEFGSYPGGLSALVDGEPVAVGILEFMQQMDIDVPKEARIPGAVYAAVDGKLSGVFAIRYSRAKSASAGLRNLCDSGNVTPLFISRDFLLTGRFLREKLKVSTKALVYPEPEARTALSEATAAEDAEVVALTVRKGLPQRSFAITGAKALRTAQNGGALIHMIGGILGLAAVAVLAYVGALELLTPVNLLLYCLLWMVPGWLITEWTRYI